jgi:hypothetical protein
MLFDDHFRSAKWSLGEKLDKGDAYRASSKRTHTRVKEGTN